jgi:hypothetical protein
LSFVSNEPNKVIFFDALLGPKEVEKLTRCATIS